MESIPRSQMRQTGEDVAGSKLRIPGPLVRQNLMHKFESTVTRELIQCHGREGRADLFTLNGYFLFLEGGRQWKRASYIQSYEKEFFDVSKVAAKRKQEKYELGSSL